MANPVVTFEMANGDVIKAELYPEIAPNTVNNFVSLVNKGFYDGLIFHRVISVQNTSDFFSFSWNRYGSRKITNIGKVDTVSVPTATVELWIDCI